MKMIRALWVVRVLVGVVVIGFVVLAAFIVFGSSDSESEQRSFAKGIWLHGTNEAKAEYPRLGMSDDLIAKKTLLGMEKKEVLAMLGEPTYENIQWGENDRFGLMYLLGPERGFMSIDSEWLGIAFDKAGKVSRYELVRD